MKDFIPVVLSGILAVSLLDAAAGDASYHPPEAEQVMETTLPSELAHLQIQNPYVLFLVNLNAAGRITQSMAVEATHFGLLEKAEQKLADCTFKPAERNGVAESAELFVSISFYDPIQRAWKRGLGELPMGHSLNDATDRKFYDMAKNNFIFRQSSPADLDSPLAIDTSEVMLVEENDKTVETGTVVVEYFIDYKGKVRFPRIIRSDHDSLRKSVLMTLSKTRFLPPKVDGNPTFVLVRQPFNFS